MPRGWISWQPHVLLTMHGGCDRVQRLQKLQNASHVWGDTFLSEMQTLLGIHDKDAVPLRSEGDARAQDVEVFHVDLGKAPSDAGVVKVQAQPGCIVHRDKGARVHDDLHQAHHEVIDASAMASRLGASGLGQDDALSCGKREGIHCHDSNIKVSGRLGIVDKAKDAPFLHDRSLTSSGSACSPATLACQRRHSSISADISSAEGASTVCPHVSIRFFW
mmetsp:Transcript_124641/g.311737  ORF Transcript_124641/g.311737 Transcript_124641/m.311737 type:complete len:219 (-) Transcript_124641:355-1011(-)